MHAAVREKRYTVSLMTHIRPEMDEDITEAANAAGLTRGEWVRKVLYDQLRGEVKGRTTLEEVLSFKQVMLILLTDLNDQLASLQADLKVSVTGRTQHDLETMVMKVDSKKHTLADKVIEESKQ